MNWHKLHLDHLFSTLESNPEGLSSSQVQQRLAHYGPNTLGEAKTTSLFQVFTRQFANILIYILLAASLLALALGNYTDSFFVALVLLINASLGAWQEWQAEQSAQKLQQLVPLKTRVRRAGQEEFVEASQLVPGDIVIIEAGNRIPADLRLLEAHTFKVNEALLTGESEGVDKEAIAMERDAPIAEMVNMAWAGSSVLSGKGIGIVVATGSKTQMGSIAQAVQTTQTSSTPLLIRFARLTHQIGFLVIGSCSAIGAYCFGTGMPLAEAVLFTIGLIVSAIPESLPIAVTIALSRGTQRMATRKVIVRKLAAVEGLGSCDCIATDKTGTLTKNEQTIEAICIPDGSSVKTTIFESDQAKTIANIGVKRLVHAGISSGSASTHVEGKKLEGHGDPVDLAFHELGHNMGLDLETLQDRLQVHKLIPFDSELRCSAAICQQGSQAVVLIKGAAEVIIARCTQTMTETGQLSPIDRNAVMDQTEALYEQAYRVIALAQVTYKGHIDTFEPAELHDINSYALLGLVGMIDPLRPEVLRAVRIAQQTGVQVIMVTGDHPTTAFAVAKRLGIASSHAQLMEGEALEVLAKEHETPEGLAKHVANITVFARVSPLQKLFIVQARKALGNFVAVTGDGVNDAPALKAAHIGVAMGSGTDIAKETASIVIANDNFATLVTGIQEGRLVYANLRKIVYLLVSTGFAEVLFVVLSLVLGLPIPLFALQLLWLNIVTNGIQDIALAFEEEQDILSQRRYLPSEPIFNRYMAAEVFGIGGVMGLICTISWYTLLHQGYAEPTARNLVFLLFVLLQNAHAINSRSEYASAFSIPWHASRWLFVGVAAALGTHLVSMHIPVMQSILHIGPVALTDWLWIVPLGLVIIPLNEGFKWVTKRIGWQ